MVHRIRMPRVDANVQEGTIGRWLVGCGERVRAGQALVEIITDKADFELEADQDGLVRRHVATEKSVVPVGYVIALLSDAPDEPLPDVAAENEAIMEDYRLSLTGRAVPAEAGASPPVEAPARGRGVRATPAARRLAEEAGLSLEGIAARVEGVVRRRDVEEELRRHSAESGQ